MLDPDIFHGFYHLFIVWFVQILIFNVQWNFWFAAYQNLLLLSYRQEILYPIAQRLFHTLRTRLGNCHFIFVYSFIVVGGFSPVFVGWDMKEFFMGVLEGE